MGATGDWLLFIGPAKTGTSWIDKVLRSADGVCLPADTKETFFFDRNYDRGADWYLGRFPKSSDDVRVEVAPTYFHAKHALERVRDMLPDARVVVTLRDPVKRSISHYLGLRKYGYTALGIDKALKTFPTITRHSLYAERLARWKDAFADVRVVFYEDVVGDVEPLFREAIPGVDPPAAIARGRVNGASVPRSRVTGLIGNRTARILRRAGLYKAIEIGKGLGLKGLLFSGGALPAKKELEQALAPWAPAFAEDRAKLTALIGRRPPW